jgi:hypothetical protein
MLPIREPFMPAAGVLAFFTPTCLFLKDGVVVFDFKLLLTMFD